MSTDFCNEKLLDWMAIQLHEIIRSLQNDVHLSFLGRLIDSIYYDYFQKKSHNANTDSALCSRKWHLIWVSTKSLLWVNRQCIKTRNDTLSIFSLLKV